MARHLSPLLLLATALVVTGCGDGDGIETGRPTLNVYHLASDAPPLDVLLGGDALVPDADYGDRARVTGRAGNRRLEARVNLPQGGTEQLAQTTEEFRRGSEWDVFAIGSHDDGYEFLVREQESIDLADGEFQLEVGHLAPGLGDVDIELEGEDTEGNSIDETIDGVVFSEFSDLQAIPAGTYSVTISDNGSEFEVANLEFEAGEQVQLFAIDNTASDRSSFPLRLMAVRDGSMGVIASDAQSANVRFIHGGPDDPIDGGYDVEVLVFADDEEEDPVYSTILSPGEWGETSLDVESALERAEYFGVILDAGGELGDETEHVFSLDVNAGEDITVVFGDVGSQGLNSFAILDDRRALATKARVRMIRGVDLNTRFRDVSLILTSPDEFPENVFPLFTLEERLSASDYAFLSEASYAADINVQSGSSGQVRENEPYSAGLVRTFVTRSVRGDSGTFEVEVIDD